jgi:hypothetical protein
LSKRVKDKKLHREQRLQQRRAAKAAKKEAKRARIANN